MRFLPQPRTSHASLTLLGVAALLSASGCVGGGAPSDPYDLGVTTPDVTGAAGTGSLQGPPPA
ncbi:MAG TPA: hypothetical protein VNG33_14845, partial [Polyangiaceae bacterium]|nr:hypothetical protein [Polyangiaceae bacterium]